MKQVFFIYLLIFAVPSISYPANLKSYTVAGLSMSPTLRPGDIVEVSAMPGRIDRSDIVSISFKGSPTPVIKRVVAVGGDHVEAMGQLLWINGRTSDPQISVDPERWAMLLRELERNDWTLPERSFLVLGDNQEDSRDSRRLGLISAEQITGKVVKVVRKGRDE